MTTLTHTIVLRKIKENNAYKMNLKAKIFLK